MSLMRLFSPIHVLVFFSIKKWLLLRAACKAVLQNETEPHTVCSFAEVRSILRDKLKWFTHLLPYLYILFIEVLLALIVTTIKISCIFKCMFGYIIFIFPMGSWYMDIYYI